MIQKEGGEAKKVENVHYSGSSILPLVFLSFPMHSDAVAPVC